MSDELGELHRAAAEHIRCGRLDAAEALLRGCLEDGPPSAQALKQLATIALRRGEIAQAKELLGRVLAAHDADPEAYTLLSALYLGDGRPEDGLLSAQRAFSLAPDNPRHAMNLALAEHAAGLVDEALARLEALAARAPSSAEIAYNLGTVYLERGRVSEAVRALSRATELDPTSREAWVNLAQAELERGAAAAALAAIDRALLLDPLSPLLLANKAGILSDSGDQERALKFAARAAVLQPGAAHPHYLQGIAHMRRGDWRAATAALAQAIRADPEHGPASYALARALRREGKFDEALLAFERAERTTAGGAPLRRARVELLLQLGRVDEAFALWDSVQSALEGAHYPDGLAGVARLLVLADHDPCVTIAFLRFIPRVAARGVEVWVAAPGDQAGIVAGVEGVVAVLGSDGEVPEGTAVAAIRKLPRLLADGVRAPAPALVPYLAVASAARTDTGTGTGARVGVCTTALPDAWAPMRYGEPPREALAAALGAGVELVPLEPRAHRLADLLQRIAAFDLVVSVDGEIAHLAGAAGCPAIVLLERGGAWGFPSAGEPWYPRVEVLRQTTPGDFSDLYAPLGTLAARLLARARA